MITSKCLPDSGFYASFTTPSITPINQTCTIDLYFWNSGDNNVSLLLSTVNRAMNKTS